MLSARRQVTLPKFHLCLAFCLEVVGSRPCDLCNMDKQGHQSMNSMNGAILFAARWGMRHEWKDMYGSSQVQGERMNSAP